MRPQLKHGPTVLFLPEDSFGLVVATLEAEAARQFPNLWLRHDKSIGTGMLFIQRGALDEFTGGAPPRPCPNL